MPKKKPAIDPVSLSSAAPARGRKYVATPKHNKAYSAPQVEDFPAVTGPSRIYDREQIALLAYSYWEGRGYQGGSAEEDWLRAEQEYCGATPTPQT